MRSNLTQNYLMNNEWISFWVLLIYTIIGRGVSVNITYHTRGVIALQQN